MAALKKRRLESPISEASPDKYHNFHSFLSYLFDVPPVPNIAGPQDPQRYMFSCSSGVCYVSTHVRFRFYPCGRLSVECTSEFEESFVRANVLGWSLKHPWQCRPVWNVKGKRGRDGGKSTLKGADRGGYTEAVNLQAVRWDFSPLTSDSSVNKDNSASIYTSI